MKINWMRCILLTAVIIVCGNSQSIAQKRTQHSIDLSAFSLGISLAYNNKDASKSYGLELDYGVNITNHVLVGSANRGYLFAPTGYNISDEKVYLWGLASINAFIRLRNNSSFPIELGLRRAAYLHADSEPYAKSFDGLYIKLFTPSKYIVKDDQTRRRRMSLGLRLSAGKLYGINDNEYVVLADLSLRFYISYHD